MARWTANLKVGPRGRWRNAMSASAESRRRPRTQSESRAYGRRAVIDARRGGPTAKVVRLLSHQPAISGVRLVGSRADGRANPFSDWDFAVETTDFESAAVALPELVRSLSPLGTFWDPLSQHQCFIVLLPGPRKIDFIFETPHDPLPPYDPAPDTLRQMDVHFWDWTIWLVAKAVSRIYRLVRSELRKMHRYLLSPLGVKRVPSTLEEAVRSYLGSRARAEERNATRVDDRLTLEAHRFMAGAGYSVRISARP